MQAQGDVGILGGVGRGLLQRDLVEGDLLGALAGDSSKWMVSWPRYFCASESMSWRVAVLSST